MHQYSPCSSLEVNWVIILKSSLLSTALHGGQRSRRLEDSYDPRAHPLCGVGALHLCHPSDPGPVRLHVDRSTGLQLHGIGRGRRCRHHPLRADVHAPLPDRPGHAAPQQAVHRCFLPQHRGSQQDQLWHPFCDEDSDDHLPRHGPAGLQCVLLDHRSVDSARLWEVSA